MQTKLPIRALLAAGLFFCGLQLQATSMLVYPQLENESTSAQDDASIVIVGDTQQTSVLEFWREKNGRQQQILFDHMAKEKTDLLLHLGDMVFNAASDGQWEYFDQLLTPFKDSHIPMAGVMGNHEYWGKDSERAKHLDARFPGLREHSFYRKNYGPLALLFLDSNFNEMKKNKEDAQVEWLKKELENIQQDPQISGVLILSHHPPYTNSKLTGLEDNVSKCRKRFASLFMNSPKAMLFLSGHAHGYERFQSKMQKNKFFVVSGGGGGPRQDYGNFHWKDISPVHPGLGRDKGPFNYVVLKLHSGGFSMTVKGLYNRKGPVKVIEQWTMSYPENSAQLSPDK